MRPRDSLQESINQAGREYYRKNPKGNLLTWLGSHKSHELADKLISYQGNPSEKDEWLFLLDIYSQQKTAKAKLAIEIESVFGKKFDVRKIGGANGFYYELPLDAVVSDLRSKVEAAFSPRPQDEVNELEMQSLTLKGRS